MFSFRLPGARPLPIRTKGRLRLAGPVAAIVLALGSLPGPATAQQDLPLEVQTDLAMLEFERAVTGKDPATILAAIDKVRALSPALAAGDMLFFEAEAAMATGDMPRAEAALNQFVTSVGRGSELYPLALEMLLDLPRIREEAAAKAQAEAEAELARQREAERQERERQQRVREQEAQAREEAARAREREAISSLETLRDIRFILYGLYGSGVLPEFRTQGLEDPFSESERDWIRKLLRTQGGYLDQDSIPRILRFGFTPRSPNFTDFNALEHSNWFSWKANDGSCHARTLAVTPQGDRSLFRVPELGVSYRPEWDRSWIGLPLLYPNNLRSDFPITLMVDDRTFELQVHEDGISVVPKGDWSAVTRALQAGQRIKVIGTDQYTRKQMEIEFSAVGFTSALQRIASQCDRTAELSRWINLR